MEEFYSNLSPVATVIIAIAFMLVFGFLITRITKRLRLPNVTAYIIAGIIIGPYCLNLIPENIIGGTAFISDIALAFIAFSVGEYFKYSTLKKAGIKVVIITLFESILASILVLIVSAFILKLPFAFSMVLSALASATAPASTIMTIRQTKAKGEYVDTLLEVVALDDIVSLVAYSVAISVAVAISMENTIKNAVAFNIVILPIIKNILAIIVGVILGFLLKALLPKKRSTDNRLIIAISVLFLFCGLCAVLDISPLLGCMVIGMIYINISNDEKLFLQLNYFNPPILLLFFVRSGVNFNLNALWSSNGFFGVPLWLAGVVYFFVRIIGKYSGAFIGSAITKKSKEIRNYLGFGLVPQAGVAIGLASLGARTLGGEMGIALETIILASSVLYELIGPAISKLGLYLSKSYSDKIEDIVVIDKKEEQKSDVELLIERIQKIKKEVEEENSKMPAEESAFTEAAINNESYTNIKRGIIKNIK